MSWLGSKKHATQGPGESRARDDELQRLDNRLRALEGGGAAATGPVVVGGVSGGTGQGPPGPPGNDGAPGPPGADGLSAYEVAVDNGFIGDEAAWLASLVGPAGPIVPLGDLTDVDLTGLQAGDMLSWDGGGWAPVDRHSDRCAAEIADDGTVVLEVRGSAWAAALTVTPDGLGEFVVQHDLNSLDYIVQVTPIGADSVARVLSKGLDDVTVECSDGVDPAGFTLLLIRV